MSSSVRILIAAILGTFPATMAAEEPWAVMTGQSVVEVRSSLRHIYQRLGKKEWVAALDSAAVTNLVTGNLKGLDLHRPLGSYVMPSAQSTGNLLVFVPMTNETDFRGFLQRHGITVGQGEGGITPIQIPLWGTAYLRFATKHAWFALRPEDLTGPLPDPEKTVPAVHRKTALASTIYLERIPPDHRQALLHRGEQALDWLFKGQDRSRAELGEVVGLPLAGVVMRKMAEDARELTLLAHADSRTDQLWAQVVFLPRPDVPWVEQVRARAQNPIKIDFPAQAWGNFRGKTDEVSQRAAAVFTKEGQDKLHLTVTGGETLTLRAEMSGAMLAYHAALSNDGEVKAKREKPPRIKRRDRNANPIK